MYFVIFLFHLYLIFCCFNCEFRIISELKKYSRCRPYIPNQIWMWNGKGEITLYNTNFSFFYFSFCIFFWGCNLFAKSIQKWTLVCFFVYGNGKSNGLQNQSFKENSTMDCLTAQSLGDPGSIPATANSVCSARVLFVRTQVFWVLIQWSS